jgi:diguanylate cyclase (GGDEF)-like protein
MKRSALKRGPRWLPSVLVLAMILVAGGRLIALSVQQQAEQSRAAAQRVASRGAEAFSVQLQRLAARASNEAARATNSLSGDEVSQLAAIAPARGAFWLSADGTPLPARQSDPALAHAIAGEWSGAPRSAGLAGPVRQGSDWLVAARAPILAPADGAAGGWAVAYTDLDHMLATTHLGRAAAEGYEFALGRVPATGGDARALISSATAPLVDPARATVRNPTGFPLAGNLEIEILPRGGWYPVSELATDIGLLALVAWLVTFMVHDMGASALRLQAALSTSRRRLKASNQRLMREVDERRSLEQSFEHARYHDAFTGLPNRRYFMDQLDRALREVRARRRRGIAVVLIDIERFKLINDTLGHTAGDELMVQAARRFQQATTQTQSVLARWGGDQFAVLALDVNSSESALALVRAMEETLREPFDLRRHRLTVTARMGVTCVGSGPQRAEDVVREADIALTAAKRQDSAPTVAYTPALAGDAASLVSLEADLHVALERNELKLLFQPIVDLRARRMVGAEALLRWRHPVEGPLRPDRFLPIAEEAGLIVPITRWTVRRVCRLAGEWRRRLPSDTEFFLSVNLSGAVLRDRGLGDYVASVLEETRMPPEVLKFELTEGSLISNVSGAREVLERLHAMGIQLMLDDFGTGYSSLNYLQLFPFDYLKIDRPMVDRTGSEQTNGALTSAMIQIAFSLGLTPIAEVVETQATALALQEMGCNFGQGYFFCAPLEPEDALQCLRGGGFNVPAGDREEAERSWTDDSPTLMLPIPTNAEHS